MTWPSQGNFPQVSPERSGACADDVLAGGGRCRAEFTIGNVRATHAERDAAAEAALHALYEQTIEFGAHPNPRGVLAATTRMDTDKGHAFGAVLLTDKPVLIAFALKTTGEVAVGALKTFRLIFPERFAIMGMDGEIDKLVDGLNAVFLAGRFR